MTCVITMSRRGDDGPYVRTDERHVLHLYDPAWMLTVLDRVGLDGEAPPDYGEQDGMPGWVAVVARRR